jgi:hypothetical protein
MTEEEESGFASIDDIRSARDFKGITFSEFKKTDVKQELIRKLYDAKIEPACYWSAELICAGHFADLWDIIISFFSKYIHAGNPKLIVYFDRRMEDFKQIFFNGYSDGELRMRNNVKIRKLFCEIMCVLCESKKKHSLMEVKVKKEDFDLTLMTERFKAPNIQYAEPIIRGKDSRELYIGVNEFAYHVSQDGANNVSACYWLEWIMTFESICRQKKELCKCERRAFIDVDSKCQMDVVWIVWEVLLNEAARRDQLTQKMVQSALNMYCVKYTSGCYRKRSLLLYFVIGLFTELYSVEDEMICDKNKIQVITSHINKIYKQIKKNEHSPKTDYLYQNMHSTNLEKTIAKLETMNQLGAEYIPRVG